MMAERAVDPSAGPLHWVLIKDETFTHVGIALLSGHGLFPLLERVPMLFSGFSRAVGEYAARTGQRDGAGLGNLPIEQAREVHILQAHMFQLAFHQYLHATSHLLRGHLYEVFAHLRTMVEASGIAYLALSEPRLTEYYFDVDKWHDYKYATRSRALFPESPRVAADLGKDFALASKMLHSNFASIAGRNKTQTTVNGDEMIIASEMYFHCPQDPEAQTELVRVAASLLAISFRVLLLFKESFQLDSESWSAQLEAFQTDVRMATDRLSPLLSIDQDNG
jgi:hypothetical protein